MKLDIVIRTCSQQSVDNDGKSRIINDSRADMILKCVDSVIKSANKSAADIHISILDDHSTAEFLQKLASITALSLHQITITNLLGSGFNNSALAQFKEGLTARELVYFVEDDYFHSDDAISAMLAFWESGITDPYRKFNAMAIHPYDCPHRYWPTLADPTLLFYHQERYWRTLQHTSNTFMTHTNVIRTFWNIFENLAMNYPTVREHNTINLLWSNLVTHGGPVACFSPIPSVAYHMSYQNEPPNVLTNIHTNYKEDWKNYEFNK